MAIPYLYTDYGDFLRREFPFKVQKISINAGFTCPNRNGEKGWGGCTYCNNQTFNPAYCRTEKTITEQLEEGKRFFGRKYPDMKFLAYFQAYTNTYGEVDEVIRKYEEALVVPDVVGIVIGTRPDCMPQALLRKRQLWNVIEYPPPIFCGTWDSEIINPAYFTEICRVVLFRMAHSKKYKGNRKKYEPCILKYMPYVLK